MWSESLLSFQLMLSVEVKHHIIKKMHVSFSLVKKLGTSSVSKVFTSIMISNMKILDRAKIIFTEASILSESMTRKLSTSWSIINFYPGTGWMSQDRMFYRIFFMLWKTVLLLLLVRMKVCKRTTNLAKRTPQNF